MVTFNEWGDLVKDSLPRFVAVAGTSGTFLNTEAAERLLDDGEYLTVFTMLEDFSEGILGDPNAIAEHAILCDLLQQYPHEEEH